MTDLAKNKQIALDFIEKMGRLETDAVLDLLTEDVKFETPGHYALAGRKTKAEVAKEFPAIRHLLPGGLKFTIHAVTAEDNRVHVELSGEAKTFDGKDYNNRYHYAFVMRDGKICEFRDYLDSDLVMRVMAPTFEKYGAVNFGRDTAPAA